MNKNLTDLNLVIDCSGSMSSCKNAIDESVNSLISNQKNESGDCNLSIVEFDNTVKSVVEAININYYIDQYNLSPRGSTALLDAIGYTINSVGKRLNETEESLRPGLVIVAIATDGYENSSKEFNGKIIKEMISHQESKYNWQFIYLGANQDAFAVADELGINLSKVSNYNINKTDSAIDSTDQLIRRMRVATAKGMSADNIVNMSYTDEERDSMA